MDRRLPSGNPVGWDSSYVADDFVGSNVDLVQLRSILSCWGDTETGDDDKSVDDVDNMKAEVEVIPREPTAEE